MYELEDMSGTRGARIPEGWRDRSAPGTMRSAPGWVVGVVLLALSATAYPASQADYTYDALGRLTKVVYSDGAKATTIIYNYDAAGNRTSVVSSTPSV